MNRLLGEEDKRDGQHAKEEQANAVLAR